MSAPAPATDAKKAMDRVKVSLKFKTEEPDDDLLELLAKINPSDDDVKEANNILSSMENTITLAEAKARLGTNLQDFLSNNVSLRDFFGKETNNHKQLTKDIHEKVFAYQKAKEIALEEERTRQDKEEKFDEILGEIKDKRTALIAVRKKTVLKTEVSPEDYQYQGLFNLRLAAQAAILIADDSVVHIVLSAFAVGRTTAKKLKGFDKIYTKVITVGHKHMTYYEWLKSFPDNLKPSHVQQLLAAANRWIMETEAFRAIVPNLLEHDNATFFGLDKENFIRHMIYRYLKKVQFAEYEAPNFIVSLNQNNISREVNGEQIIAVTTLEFNNRWDMAHPNYAGLNPANFSVNVDNERNKDLLLSEEVNAAQKLRARQMFDLTLKMKPPNWK